jgi:hypothetical protein
VLLGRGGDDGLWMRLLGSGVDDFHRCGCLILTPEAVAYAERCAKRPRPKSNLGLAFRGAVLSKFHFDWVWTARAADIRSTLVEPAVESRHGPFVAVNFEVSGEHFRFGVRAAKPNLNACLTAARALGNSSLATRRASVRPPRTDGIYVRGREQNSSPHMEVLYFDGTHVAYFSTYNLQHDLQLVLTGEQSYELDEYRDDGSAYVIPSLGLEIIVVDDDRLIYWHESARETFFPAPYGEYIFVSHEEVEQGWGTIRASLHEAPWKPVVSGHTWSPMGSAPVVSGGTLVAPEIG